MESISKVLVHSKFTNKIRHLEINLISCLLTIDLSLCLSKEYCRYSILYKCIIKYRKTNSRISIGLFALTMLHVV